MSQQAAFCRGHQKVAGPDRPHRQQQGQSRGSTVTAGTLWHGWHKERVPWLRCTRDGSCRAELLLWPQHSGWATACKHRTQQASRTNHCFHILLICNKCSVVLLKHSNFTSARLPADVCWPLPAGRCVQGQRTTLCLIKPHAVRQGQSGAILAALQQQFVVTALQQFHIDAVNAAGGPACSLCPVLLQLSLTVQPALDTTGMPVDGSIPWYLQKQYRGCCPVPPDIKCPTGATKSGNQTLSVVTNNSAISAVAEFFEVYKGVVPPGEFGSMVSELTSGEWPVQG